MRFRLSDQLDPLLFKDLIKSCQRQSRAVDLGRGDLDLVKAIGAHDDLKVKILHDLCQRDLVYLLQ